jgi:long-chain acyl-CoA synthetase
MSTDLALDRLLATEAARGAETWLTQPMGGGEVKELTWAEAVGQARRMATHLRSLDLPAGTHIAIFSKNTAWWILADVAIWMAGHVSIPLYPTLTAETIAQVLEHSGAKLIFIGKLDGYDEMKPGIPEALPRIILPLSPETGFDKWDDLIAGAEPLAEVAQRTDDEVATVIYTSGSTGAPKGVMLTFGAMATATKGIIQQLGVSSSDRMLSYLPLAHAFERWIVEHTTLMSGFSVYFAESLNTFVADLRRARPTLFISVPRLWQKFQLGVLAKMPREKLARLLKIPILNRVIRKKVLTGLGLQEVRFAGSGSAPIPPELIQWYQDLGLELLEGYGMTENFSYSHCNKPGKSRPGYVGSVYENVECRLSEEGEILVKSPGSMKGYYNAPELTAEAFTEDGFLKTGDRGEMDSEGRLRITGRTKELFKTSKGKYVAPAPIENKLLVHPRVEMACVTGNGFPKPHGLVMLSEQARAELAGGGDGVRSAITGELTALLDQVNGVLDHHEQMQFLAVVADEWLIENGFLTPTMKLKRAKVDEVYTPHAEGWYGAGDRVVWEA